MSARVLLRPLTRADTDTVFTLTSDPAVARYMKFDTHTSRAQAQALIRDWTTGGSRAFLVLDGETPVGVAAFKAAGEDPGARSVSLFSFPAAWGKGYGGAALAALVEEARRAGLRVLRGYIVEENTASRALAEGAGFSLERVFQEEPYPSRLFVYSKTL